MHQEAVCLNGGGKPVHVMLVGCLKKAGRGAGRPVNTGKIGEYRYSGGWGEGRASVFIEVFSPTPRSGLHLKGAEELST